MSNITMKWIQAGKVLAQDSSKLVLCPQCEHTTLEVTDVINEVNPTEFERLMSCPICGAKNILRLKRPKNT